MHGLVDGKKSIGEMEGLLDEKGDGRKETWTAKYCFLSKLICLCYKTTTSRYQTIQVYNSFIVDIHQPHIPAISIGVVICHGCFVYGEINHRDRLTIARTRPWTVRWWEKKRLDGTQETLTIVTERRSLAVLWNPKGKDVVNLYVFLFVGEEKIQ